jgi:hypothetical protein
VVVLVVVGRRWQRWDDSGNGLDLWAFGFLFFSKTICRERKSPHGTALP